MGTRNLTIVQKDNQYKIAQYGQWDGYPSGNGIIILNFLKKVDLEKFKKKIDTVKLVTNEDINKYWADIGVDVEKERFVSMDVSEKFYKLHPSLSRDLGASVLDYIMEEDNVVESYLDIDFANDSLFCEWAYVIDLDKNTFEVYTGFVKDPIDKSERFYNDGYVKNGYYPIKLAKTYRLDELPTKEDFLKDLE